MNPSEIMKRPAAYASGYENTPTEAQARAKQLCWEYNRTAPNETEKRRAILQQLLGTCSPMTGIEPDFHCDYGFNIHTHGLAVIKLQLRHSGYFAGEHRRGRVYCARCLSGLFRPCGRPGTAQPWRWNFCAHHAGRKRLDRSQCRGLRRRDHWRRFGHWCRECGNA